MVQPLNSLTNYVASKCNSIGIGCLGNRKVCLLGGTAVLICALIIIMKASSFLYASNSNVRITKSGRGTSVVHAQDVVFYSMYKGYPRVIADLKARYKGLENEKQMDELLQQQKYIEVLNHLWSESDTARKIGWLEEKVDEGHPILMFELAEEYYFQTPTLSTYMLKSRPWLVAGAERTTVDVGTTSDRTVSAAVGLLCSSYDNRIAANIRARFSEETIRADGKAHEEECRKEINIILKRVLTPFTDERIEKMPSPEWVFAHGLAALRNGKNTISTSDYDAIRMKTAKELLEASDQAEKKQAENAQ